MRVGAATLRSCAIDRAMFFANSKFSSLRGILLLEDCDTSEESTFLEDAAFTQLRPPLLEQRAVIVTVVGRHMNHLVNQTAQLDAVRLVLLTVEKDFVRVFLAHKTFGAGDIFLFTRECPPNDDVRGQFPVEEFLVNLGVPLLQSSVAPHLSLR